MPTTTCSLYMITTRDYRAIDRIWYYTQYQALDIPMYKSRISSSTTAWVVELDLNSSKSSMFLLQFGDLVTSIAATYYG